MKAALKKPWNDRKGMNLWQGYVEHHDNNVLEEDVESTGPKL